MLYKLISLLLQYPSTGIIVARPDLDRAVGHLPKPEQRQLLEQFLSYFMRTPADALQREYVATFDAHKASSLYLSSHVLSDCAQRSAAIAALKERYAAAGFPLTQLEIPDYLPVMLEFASVVPDDVALQTLSDFRGAIESVRLSLHNVGSVYRYLLDALCLDLPVGEADWQEVTAVPPPGSHRAERGPSMPSGIVPLLGDRGLS